MPFSNLDAFLALMIQTPLYRSVWTTTKRRAHESVEDEAEFCLPCVDAPLTLAEIYAGVNVGPPVYRGDIG